MTIIIEKEICVHYWIIEESLGSTSHGVCKHCGTENDFKNFLEHYGSYGKNLHFNRGKLGRKVKENDRNTRPLLDNLW